MLCLMVFVKTVKNQKMVVKRTQMERRNCYVWTFSFIVTKKAHGFLSDYIPYLSTNKRRFCWHVHMWCLLPAAWPTEHVQAGLEMSQCQLSSQPSCTHSPLTPPGAAPPWQSEVTFPFLLLSLFFLYIPSNCIILMPPKLKLKKHIKFHRQDWHCDGGICSGKAVMSTNPRI